MRFRDILTDRWAHYSLGVDDRSGSSYLSIPVSIGVADYEEYYALAEAELERFREHPVEAASFADACRRRECDERLLVQPGWNRGTPT